MEVWHNPACSKCAAARDSLDAARVPYRLRAYLDDPPGVEELREVLRRLGARPWEICRTGEPAAAALGMAGWARDDAAEGRWLAAMVDHPELIQRPILLLDDGSALVGRTPGTVAEAARRAGGQGVTPSG
jgi:arsenate reductase